MARTKGSKNFNIYRWKLEKDNEIKYFKTNSEICQFLVITPPTLYRFLKDNKSSRKLINSNIKIEKVERPCFVKVENTN